jgi:peptide/nickel transport system substrate-binding protein
MKKGFIAAIIGILLLSFTAVSYAAKDEIVVCQGAEVNSLDPARHNSVTDFNYAIQVFDSLYYPDAKGIPQPRLALSHKVINETTWEIKLRKGVKFHDGSTFTSKDAKFSIDRMTDPNVKALFASFYSTIKEVNVVDDNTIRIITKAPDPILLNRLTLSMWMLPADLFQKQGAETFFQKPVGTGAFKFVSWSRNDRMVFDANPTYWAGAPKVKKLVIRPVPEVAARIAELQTGNADIISGVPPFLLAKLKETPDITLHSVLSGRAIFVYINTTATAQEALKNKKVRQAMEYAIDRKSIIDNILLGSGTPNAVGLTNYHFGFDPGVKPYPYDPAKAKKLLAEAGYANGFKVEFLTPSGRYLMDKEIAEAVAKMLNAVGIQTELKVLEWGSLVQTYSGKKLKDIGFIGWGNTIYDADGTLTPYYGSLESPFSYFSNASIADKINKGRITMDKKKRIAIYKQIQAELFDEAPLIYLYQPIDNWATSKDLKGFVPRGDEQIPLWNVSK